MTVGESVNGRKRHRGGGTGFSLHALRRRLGAAGFVAALSVALVAVSSPAPALAADMAVSVAPAGNTTTKSGVATTYTLTYSCSNASGSCANSVVTIPTNTLTGNGSTTDFSAWVSSLTCPAVNKSVAGQVSFSLGTISTGTYTCTFRVFPPEYTTLNNVTLPGPTIVESAFSGTGGLATPDCGKGALAPGADVTCDVTYHLTQEDVDAGTVENTAVATATFGATAVSSAPSTAKVSIDRKPALSLVKSASPAAPADFTAGRQITYSFVITNTGNVTIADPGVKETAFTGSGTLDAPACPNVGALAPGAQLICSTVYTVTQADIDAASVTNTATAAGTGPLGTAPVTPSSSSVTVPEPSKPALALLKTTDARKVAAAGQIVTYLFTVTNTGNTTATAVGVEEGSFSGRGSAPVVDCALGTLLPGQTASCSARYTVVAADLDGRPLVNTARAFSGSPSGAGIVSDPSSATIEDVMIAGDPAAGDLARTGSTIAWGGGAVALALLAAGGLLLGLRRRRRPGAH